MVRAQPQTWAPRTQGGRPWGCEVAHPGCAGGPPPSFTLAGALRLGFWVYWRPGERRTPGGAGGAGVRARARGPSVAPVTRPAPDRAAPGPSRRRGRRGPSADPFRRGERSGPVRPSRDPARAGARTLKGKPRPDPSPKCQGPRTGRLFTTRVLARRPNRPVPQKCSRRTLQRRTFLVIPPD